jgi:hypothetical protein
MTDRKTFEEMLHETVVCHVPLRHKLVSLVPDTEELTDLGEAAFNTRYRFTVQVSCDITGPRYGYRSEARRNAAKILVRHLNHTAIVGLLDIHDSLMAEGTASNEVLAQVMALVRELGGGNQ